LTSTMRGSPSTNALKAIPIPALSKIPWKRRSLSFSASSERTRSLTSCPI